MEKPPKAYTMKSKVKELDVGRKTYREPNIFWGKKQFILFCCDIDEGIPYYDI